MLLVVPIESSLDAKTLPEASKIETMVSRLLPTSLETETCIGPLRLVVKLNTSTSVLDSISIRLFDNEPELVPGERVMRSTGCSIGRGLKMFAIK